MKWISVKKRLPKEDGRYLTLRTFKEPMICNNSIVRKYLPFVCNYRREKGWASLLEDEVVTHWMKIPKFEEGMEE